MMVRADPLLMRAFAHRGLHDSQTGRPENSRAAFSAAIDAGYGIELDIQMSRDGQAMVFHDDDLSRLTPARGPIQQQDAAKLRQFPLKGGTEAIPTLSQILNLVDGATPLLLEIKDQDGALGPKIGDLETAVAQDLKAYDGDAFIMSFNPHSVRYMSQILPNTPRGLVTCAFSKKSFELVPEDTRDRLRQIPDFEAVGASFISHSLRDLDRKRVQEMRGNGTPVLCWTVKSEAEEARALRLSDNITFEGYPAAKRTT